MFEILVGDLFEVDGDLVAVFKLRVAVVGESVRTFVHYSHRGAARIRPAEEFCAWLAEALASGAARNLNREADFPGG